MSCKGICARHKAKRVAGGSMYDAGLKRCSVCELYMKWDGYYCPCCGMKLQTRARIAGKKRQQEIVRI